MLSNREINCSAQLLTSIEVKEKPKGSETKPKKEAQSLKTIPPPSLVKYNLLN